MAKPAKRTVYLLGDAPLVEEFGGVCHAAGLSVAGGTNERSTSRRSIGAVKRSSTVPRTSEWVFELTNGDAERKRKNIRFLERQSPPNSMICSSSVTVTAARQASWLRSPQRLIGISAFPTLLSGRLLEVAPTRHTAASDVRRLETFLSSIGKECAVVQDRIGMVLPRMLCMLVNEAAFALNEAIASPGDIDTAMKLGTNYPFGPIEWGEKIGFGNVVDVLGALLDDLQEERYRIAPLLQQLAAGPKWWGT